MLKKKSVMIATFKAHLKQKAIDTVNQYFTCIDILMTALLMFRCIFIKLQKNVYRRLS